VIKTGIKNPQAIQSVAMTTIADEGCQTIDFSTEE